MKDYILTEMPLDFKRYHILNNKAKRHLSHIGYHGLLPTNKSPFGSPSKMMKKELKKEIDYLLEDNKNTISEYMKMILTSTPLGNEKLLKVENLLSSLIVRSFFAKCLYQDKFDDNKLQILNDRGFDDLNYMVFHALLSSKNSPSQYEDIRLITKSCFFYYK
jgi:hypothetical protein